MDTESCLAFVLLVALVGLGHYLTACSDRTDLHISCVPDAHAPTKSDVPANPTDPTSPTQAVDAQPPPEDLITEDTLAFDDFDADTFPLDAFPSDTQPTDPDTILPTGCLVMGCFSEALAPLACDIHTQACVAASRLFDLCDPQNPTCAPGMVCNQDPHSPNWRCQIPCQNIFDCPRAEPDLHCLENVCAPLNPPETLSSGYYVEAHWMNCQQKILVAGTFGCTCDTNSDCATYGTAHVCTSTGLCR